MHNTINDFILKHYPNKGSKFCSEKFNISKSAVNKRAMRLGVKVSPERFSKMCSDSALKMWKENPLPRNVNADLFIKSLIPESVYLLGFIWADGYLTNPAKYYKIRVEIKRSDALMLTPIFEKTGKWSIYKRCKGGFKPSPKITFTANNSILYKFLEKMDYRIKSYASANKIIKYLPKNLRYLWWRGFFDGDGWVSINRKNYTYQIGLSGSFKQDWSFLDNLNSLGFKFTITRISKKKQDGYKSSHARISKKESCKKFSNYIYKDNIEIGLKRKKDILDQL